MAKQKKSGKRMLLMIAASYLVVVMILFFNQRNMMYFPYQGFPDPAAIGVPEMKAIEVTTKDNLTLRALYKAPDNPSLPVVVLFHGNGGSIAIRGYRAREFMDNSPGVGYLLAEYRGYASNSGKPTEEGLYNDARAYMDWLILDQKIPQSRIVLYGESLGTGIATQMALEYADAKALILEAPYTSMQAVAQKHLFWLPAYWLVKDRYNNIDKVTQVKMPLLVLHGQKDSVIPYDHGVKVFQNAKTSKRLESFCGGNHVDLVSRGAGHKARQFLASYPSD